MPRKRIDDLIIQHLVVTKSFTIQDVALVTALLLASGQVVDLNGESYGLVLDADADTAIGAPVDDVINIKLNGAEDFQIAVNLLTALSGSVIATNTISETTAASGVTIDSLLVKDAGLVVGASGVVDLNGEADALVLDADGNTSISAPTDNQIDIEINNADDFRFTADTFTALSGSTVATNTIAETTATSGVTVDGLLIKDGVANTPTLVAAAAGSGAITISVTNKTYFITAAGAAALTIVDPTATTHDGVTLTFIATTAQAHTLSNAAGSGFFSSGGATKDVATFGGAIGDRISIIAYQGKWYILDSLNITLG